MVSSLTFHELDYVFLQTQARIWLEEMLNTRFDERISICDLLADGELLFEVSQKLWNLLLVKYMELKSYKARMFIPVDTRRSSGRYRPYSNVDSFLKVCKVLGLSGVDLFSPSDVVEKRDTRKVPDFDVVTNTVAMPTDVVRGIRRNLELSPSSVIHEQSKHTRLKFRQKSSIASHTQEDELCHEESDESISNFSDTSYADFLYLESGGSPMTAENYVLTQGKQDAEVSNLDMDRFVPPGSAESLFLQYVYSDNQLDGIPSPGCESRLIISDEVTPINHEAKFRNDSLSDLISFRILTNVPFHISEDCMSHSDIGTESHNSNTTPNASMCRVWKKFPGEIEASPSSSMSSVLGRVLDFDFDTTSKPDDQRTLASDSCDRSKLEILDLSGDSFSPYWDDEKSCGAVDQDPESLNQISETQKDLGDSLTLVKDNVTEVANCIQVTMLSKELNNKLMKSFEMADAKSTWKVDNNHNICNHRSSKGFGNVNKEDDLLCTNLSYDDYYYAEDRTDAADKDERKDVHIDCLVVVDTSDKRAVNTEKKSTYIAPLLKTVVKGTALIGFFFLLHFRITGDGNTNNKSTKKSSQIHWKSSGVVFSRSKGETRSKIYPAEKFKFGN